MIREATNSDLDYINEILKYFKQPIINKINNKVYIIEGIGLISYQYLYDVAELYYLYVEETYRHQKYGLKLLKKMEIDCLQKGIKKVFLEVRKSNQSAIDFYINNGFKVIKSRDNYYHNPVEDALILEKKLGD